MGGWEVGGWEVGGWEVGDGRATVTGKFDSIDSIVGPIRCRCLRLVGWACLFFVMYGVRFGRKIGSTSLCPVLWGACDKGPRWADA